MQIMTGKTSLASAAAAYKPEPLDLEGVALPESLLLLTETIARNTHEVWAARRMVKLGYAITSPDEGASK